MSTCSNGLCRYLKLLFLAVATVFLLAAAPAQGLCTPAAYGRQVILIVVDRVTWPEMEAAAGPELAQLMKGDGAGVGIMNNVTARKSPGSAYLTIGASSRALGSPWSQFAFQPSREKDLRAQELFYRYNGWVPPPAAIYHLYPRLLQHINDGQPYPLQVGALGDTLRQQGFSQAVIGSAGAPGEGGEAVALAMDSRGAVAEGDMYANLIPDDNFPGGWITDPRLTWQELQSVSAELVVIDWGDTTRIDQEADRLVPGRRRELLQESFARLDSFLAMLRQEMGNRLLLLVVPSAPANAGAEGGLTPVLMVGNYTGGGLLTSASTRGEGIVSNLDLAPTVLDYLGIEVPAVMMGQPLEIIPRVLPEGYVTNRLDRITRVNRQRPGILRAYVILQIVALAAGLGTIIFLPGFAAAVRFLFAGLMLFPLVLLLPIAPLETALFTGGLLAGITVLLTAFLMATLRDDIVILLTVAGLTVAGILIDQLFLQGILIKNSFLGYDPVSGARYYGLGNEYMGVLVGALPLFATALVEKTHNSKWWLLPVGLTAVAAFLVLGSPRLGANFGGTVSSLVAFTALLLLLSGAGVKKAAAGFTAILVSGMIVVYMINSNATAGTSSHLGRALQLIEQGGREPLWDMIYRKLSMNIKLLRYSLWSRVFLLALVVLPLLFYRPVGALRNVFKTYPFMLKGMAAAFLGSVTALAVNDSGVVAAATAMLFVILPLLFILAGERENTV